MKESGWVHQRWMSLGLVLVVCLALLLRAENVCRFPPGLSRDEAVNALDAFKVADGTGFPFYEDANRPEPLYRLVQGAVVLVWGRRVWALRLLSALVGALTVAVAYRAVVEAQHHQRVCIRRLAGLAGAAVLAVSVSYVALSRTL